MVYLLKWVGWEDSLSLASGAQALMQAVYEASIKQAGGMLKQVSRQRLQAARLEIQATPLLSCPFSSSYVYVSAGRGLGMH